MNEIIQIIYKTNYIYYIMFDDGTRTDIDFSGYIVNNPDLNRYNR